MSSLVLLRFTWPIAVSSLPIIISSGCSSCKSAIGRCHPVLHSHFVTTCSSLQLLEGLPRSSTQGQRDENSASPPQQFAVMFCAQVWQCQSQNVRRCNWKSVVTLVLRFWRFCESMSSEANSLPSEFAVLRIETRSCKFNLRDSN